MSKLCFVTLIPEDTSFLFRKYFVIDDIFLYKKTVYCKCAVGWIIIDEICYGKMTVFSPLGISVMKHKFQILSGIFDSQIALNSFNFKNDFASQNF